jgi:hypothetical protein
MQQPHQEADLQGRVELRADRVELRADVGPHATAGRQASIASSTHDQLVHWPHKPGKALSKAAAVKLAVLVSYTTLPPTTRKPLASKTITSKVNLG